MERFDIVIIGAGVTGLIALGTLPEEYRRMSRICIIDSSFSGGDLGIKWGAIKSNTTAKQVRDALRCVPGFKTAHLELDKYSDAEYVPLHVVATDVQMAASHVLSTVETIADTVSSICRVAEWWQINFGHAPRICASKIILCTGGEPRSLDIAKPTLPLEVVFDPARLARFVRTGDAVTVFGASHSGILAVRNLVNAGLRVFLIYSGRRGTDGNKPFLFARDGEYEGVKGDAADICDSILAGNEPNVSLAAFTNGSAVANAVLRSKFIIYAIGFQSRSGICVGGNCANGGIAATYNPETGVVAHNIWGFGTGFPSATIIDGITHYDIGIPSFVSHLATCIPTIIAPPDTTTDTTTDTMTDATTDAITTQ